MEILKKVEGTCTIKLGNSDKILDEKSLAKQGMIYYYLFISFRGEFHVKALQSLSAFGGSIFLRFPFDHQTSLCLTIHDYRI